MPERAHDLCHLDYLASGQFLARNLRFKRPRLSIHSTRRGLIGPGRLFNYGAYYHPMLYWMIGGAVIPAVTWLILRRWPQCWLRYFHFPIALTGLEFVPPASGINFSSSLIVGFIFRESGSFLSHALRVPLS